tara:strand:- start:44 stop:430 length:387 start_codon:yes stop_codon:yes gene_type:complete
MRIRNNINNINNNDLHYLRANIINLSNESEVIKQNSIKHISSYIKQFIQKNKNKKNKKELFLMMLKKEGLQNINLVEELFEDILDNIELNSVSRKEVRDLESLKSAKITGKKKDNFLLNAQISKKKKS